MSDRPPTPYPNLNRVLSRLVRWTQEILAHDLRGIYLQGSFAVGDFDRHSDVDFIAAIGHTLSASQVTALQAVHGRLFTLSSTWAKHLEGSYIPCDKLARPPQAEDQFYYLDNGARSLVQSDHCNTLVVRWTLHNKGIILFGPPPASFIPPVSEAALKNEVRATMRDWGREILDQPLRFNNRFYQGFILLSYCRMLHTLKFGQIASKKTCAAWAKKALHSSWGDLIDRSWDTRPDPAKSVREPAGAADFARTLDFVRISMRMAEG